MFNYIHKTQPFKIIYFETYAINEKLSLKYKN